MLPHFGVVALVALIPLALRFVFFYPEKIQAHWISSGNLDPARLNARKWVPILLGAYVLSFMMSMIVFYFTVHQTSVYSMLQGEPGYLEEGTPVMVEINRLMDLYGDRFRTFPHGVFHGIVVGLTIILPVFGINAMYERKDWKYILINFTYWTVTISLMGGALCQWGGGEPPM